MITRRSFLKWSAAGAGVGGAVGLYTWRWEPEWVEFVQRPLPIANLPDDLRGIRLVQLSDLHIGPRVDDAYLIHTFEAVKRLAPEFVVYTGDFISYEPGIFAHVERVFDHLPVGQRGTVGVLGNHDYGPGWSHPEVAWEISRLATAAGVQILRNEVTQVGGLQMVGFDDLWAEQFRVRRGLSGLDRGKATLALSHNPDTVDRKGWEKFSGWILSGHTHGGQCKPPFLPPPMLPVQNRRYTSGEFALSGDRKMYINRGVGHALRVRFNARPEVTVFHLQPA